MASIYYVHQKLSYVFEHENGFVWSPKKAKGGKDNIGFKNMTLIQSGDYILHHCKGRIRSISKVTSGCFDCQKPRGYTNGQWQNDGYMVVTKYYDLDIPFNVLLHKANLSCPANAKKGNAFDSYGKPTQHYICVLEDNQAEYLLRHMLIGQSSKSVVDLIVSAIESLGFSGGIDDDESIYTDDEKIKDVWGACSGKWNGVKKPQQTVVAGNTNRVLQYRDRKVSINALKIADNKCENDAAHATFTRKGFNIDYMESHHLIPISRYQDFSDSLDVEENIVCLCPTCHRLLHHGTIAEKSILLHKLYTSRIQALRQCGLDVSYLQLEGYYK